VLDTRRHNYIFTWEEGRPRSIPHMVDAIARHPDRLAETSESVASTAPVANGTPNLAAYQAYFEGEELLSRLEFAAAGKAFEAAIASDSSFALAYYRLAYTEWWSRQNAAQAKRHIAYAIANLDRIPMKERYLVRALNVALEDGFEAQLSVLTEMLKLYPYDKEMLLARDAESIPTSDSAAVALRAALAIDPEMERVAAPFVDVVTMDRHDEPPSRNAGRRRPASEAYEYLRSRASVWGSLRRYGDSGGGQVRDSWPLSSFAGSVRALRDGPPAGSAFATLPSA
jgi:tetratricopeptide (TPR) repeat protein